VPRNIFLYERALDYQRGALFSHRNWLTLTAFSTFEKALAYLNVAPIAWQTNDNRMFIAECESAQGTQAVRISRVEVDSHERVSS